MTLLEAALKVWPHVVQPLDKGVEDGIVWATCYSPTAGVNGYVLIPAEGHPWSTGFPGVYDEMPLDVHGNVTYYEHPWIGFDTCHAWDVWAPEYDHYGITRRYMDSHSLHWSPELVAEEAKNLARQVAAIGNVVDVEWTELPPPKELE